MGLIKIKTYFVVYPNTTELLTRVESTIEIDWGRPNSPANELASWDGTSLRSILIMY